MAPARQLQRQLGTGLALLLALVLLTAGCGGGGGSGDVAGGNNGGSGGNNNPPPPPPPDDDPVQVEGPNALVQWRAASGAVAGYTVLVSRNGGSFQVELQSTETRANVKGEPGDRVLVRVAAFDAFGNSGPSSPASDQIVFVAPPPGSGGDDGGSDDGGTSPTDGGDDGEVAGGGDGGGSSPGSDPGETPDEEPNLTPTRPGDVDGDGAVDLLWQTADLGLVRITPPDLSRARIYSLPAGSWRATAIGDFDGDLLEDVLFAGNGTLAIARALSLRGNGGELALETWSTLPAGGVPAATGDFDGDGASDVLITTASGPYLALSNGSSAELPPLAPFSAVVGGGDADGDGHADLFVQGDGVSLLRLVGGALAGSADVPAPIATAVEGIADFDGDGRHDLAFRTAPDSLTVQHAQAPYTSWVEAAPAGAALTGCRDYDADGSLDRLYKDAEGLHLVTAGGAQAVPVDPAAPWRLVRDCK